MTTRELEKKMFMIKIENISRSFGVVKTVKKPSFEVKAGEVFALLVPRVATIIWLHPPQLWPLRVWGYA